MPVILKHVFMIGAAFAVATFIFLLTVDMIVMPFYLNTGKGLDAPELLGKTLAEAESTARRNNLSIDKEGEDFHNSYPKGTIYLQIPNPGTKVKPGRTMRIFVSMGPRPITMPNVVGKTPRNARYAIQDAGLKSPQEVWIPSNEHLYGIVARQYPEGNIDVPDTTDVILYISNGRKETNVIMPNLLNLSLSAARDSLKAYMFNLALLRIQREEQPDLLPDTVIDQYPDPGRPANTNDEVNLVVSSVPKRDEDE